MKRVYCLYRVSTLGQVEKDDIPMQRQACHAFAEKQGWQIIAEFSEKGVSGFKQSAEQREALVAIKQAAILKKFDVLLVFMFDRLGRRDDETPFVVEWFVKNGIAVWSVMEGEQRFENHVDKLLNYIRFWQSSGESIKTALRTRVRMEQLIQENGYVGGTAPYGYRLCKLGRVNKRGFEVHDLLMDPAKAEVIKTIFRLYCEEDMGPYAQSPALRRRLEVGTILLTCIGAGIEPAFGKVEHLKRQPVFFPAFALRNAGGNLMNAAGCAGFGHWGSTAYMTLYVSAQNTGFVMTNELGHLHNLASVFSETLDTPQALILAGENYQSVYEVLTKKTLSKRHGKKGFVDYSEAYQKLSIPACIVSCDNTGVMQLAVMRQTDYRARIAQAAFGARWDSKDDGIPEADGHVDGNPLVIAVDMDLRRLDRVCTAAVRQGRKEIMVAALEGQMSGLLLSILPKNAPVRPLRINAQVLSVAFGGDCKTGDPWPDAPLTLKGGFVHV